jgi:hypothetical protein
LAHTDTVVMIDELELLVFTPAGSSELGMHTFSG